MAKTNKKQGGKDAGLRAALESVAALIKSPGSEAGAQLPLIPSAGAADPGPVEPVEEKRGPGRPAGALNVATKAWRDHLLSRYPSPLQVLAEIMARPVAALAVELRCSMYEAFEAQMKCAALLAPYLHSKMPVAVEIEAAGLPVLAFSASPLMVELMQRAASGETFEGDWVEIKNAEKSMASANGADKVGSDAVGRNDTTP